MLLLEVTGLFETQESAGSGVSSRNRCIRCVLPVPWGGSAGREGKEPLCVCLCNVCVYVGGHEVVDVHVTHSSTWPLGDGENPPSLSSSTLKFTGLGHSVVSKTLGLIPKFKLKYSLCLLRTRAGN